jgi:hypothetical protein
VELLCAVSEIRSVTVSDTLQVTQQTRVTCAECCSRATRRKVELFEAGHRAVAESLAAPPQFKRTRQTLQKDREWEGETNLGSPREESAALAALVRSGRATADAPKNRAVLFRLYRFCFSCDGNLYVSALLEGHIVAIFISQ